MYKTVSNEGNFTQTINKSRFIARIVHTETEEDAKKVIAEEKKKYPDARHCCWAYVMGEKSDTLRYGDDGEPQGTAGLPMLEVLRKKGVTDVTVAVTRYFGGILLGTGGLTRAYSSSCAEALEKATLACKRQCKNLTVKLDYSTYSAIKLNLENFSDAVNENTEYTDCVTVTFAVKSEKTEEMCKLITELTGGKVVPAVGEEYFRVWDE